MSKDRIDLKYYENKYTFETPIDPNWNGVPWTTADLKVILDELKRCYYEIDLLREYAKCGNCGGQYIGPIDYGLHEWDHSEDCVYASEVTKQEKQPSELY